MGLISFTKLKEGNFKELVDEIEKISPQEVSYYLRQVQPPKSPNHPTGEFETVKNEEIKNEKSS